MASAGAGPSTAPSTTASASAMGLVLRAHAAERDARKQRLDKAVEHVLVVADDIENNCRAALGMQLQAAAGNQAALEASVRGLRTQVASLGKVCTTYGQQYEALVGAVTELGPMENYLRQTDGALAKVGENLDYIASRLTSEE
jgi:hypothetical protein